MKMFLMFIQPGCASCQQEISDAEKFKKQDILDLNGQHRLLVVDTSIPQNLPYMDLFQPHSLPTMFVVESGSLDILAETSGIGCIDAAYKTVGVPTNWAETDG